MSATAAGACAHISETLGEGLAGTAPADAGVLVLEQPGPWGRDALADSALAPVAGELGAAAAAASLKLLVVRRQTGRYDLGGERSAWLAGCAAGGRFLERLTVRDPRELLELPLSASVPTGAGVLEPGPLALPCTHSTRDACCARLGLPLARGLREAGWEAWHSSHLGGHRFAPTMAVLPQGLWLGRVVPGVLGAVLAALDDDRVPIDQLRGRIGLTPAEQAAEIAVRRATGLDGLDAVRVTETTGETVRVAATDGRAWDVRVSREPTGTVRAMSCGVDAKHEDPGRWVTDVAPADAASRPRMKA